MQNNSSGLNVDSNNNFNILNEDNNLNDMFSSLLNKIDYHPTIMGPGYARGLGAVLNDDPEIIERLKALCTPRSTRSGNSNGENNVDIVGFVKTLIDKVIEPIAGENDGNVNKVKKQMHDDIAKIKIKEQNIDDGDGENNRLNY